MTAPQKLERILRIIGLFAVVITFADVWWLAKYVWLVFTGVAVALVIVREIEWRRADSLHERQDQT